ncbi:MAG: metallophosphoesterase, partial [Dehalococcoidia bacterium]|nr:metallophosphoesterase [Dehalococcoidia bacterium]
MVGAGDIADCGTPGAAATAKLLDGIAGTVFTLGDDAYPSGSASDFARCYDPTWGRHKARTRPAPGNHEYKAPGAAPYFAYFGAAAGEPGKGYYSYNVGAWHVVSLNSSCSDVGGCGAGSPQMRWLLADLAASPAKCTLAIWHEPVFSSGGHGSSSAMQAIWQALYNAGADVVLGGHDHDYERFAPQDAAGKADPNRGMREFVVGTGGATRTPLLPRLANSQVSNSGAYGVLKLTLR